VIGRRHEHFHSVGIDDLLILQLWLGPLLFLLRMKKRRKSSLM